MLRTNLITIGIILATVLVAFFLVLAGSQNSIDLYNVPLFAICGLLIFIIQWIAFIPSYTFKTEKYFDLTGSLTYITMTILVLATKNTLEIPTSIIVIFVGIWAIRLGVFLFRRIFLAGSDTRFDNLKTNFLKLLMTWTLQGLWVFVTFGAGLAAITSLNESTLGILDGVGVFIFIFGFSVEVISDQQKLQFRNTKDNQFITIGLWKYSRHPNYLGEIFVWIGIAVISFNILVGWQYFTLISPLFVILLLTKITGIPMLESKSNTKWGHLTEYQNYKKKTPVLFPNIVNLLSRK